MKWPYFSVFACMVLMSCKERGGEPVSPNKQPVSSPLSSWNDGTAKKAIIGFVSKTTTKGGKDFVPVADRIACFDNDGTLWSEQPLYFQLAFAIDRVEALAPRHPEWQKQQPFKALLEGRIQEALDGGQQSLLQIVAASHAGISTDEFNTAVKSWIDTATHVQTGRKYKDMVFQPMIELLAYLREHEYKIFIVSGGGLDFMRAWAPEVYLVPGEQIIGSTLMLKYETAKDGTPRLTKRPGLNFIDDHAGKPVAMHQHIGKRPILSFGNSDGDNEMLQWTTSATGYPRLGLILRHTDAVREWAYDRQSPVGRLDKALDDAGKNGWLLVDMKNDWETIYPEKR